MSDNLHGFLKSLGQDPEKLNTFKSNPDEVMDSHNLTEEEKAAVKSGDKAKLQSMTGADDADAQYFIV